MDRTHSQNTAEFYFDAIASGNLAEVQQYVCCGVDGDVKALRNGEVKYSPLHVAVLHNRLDIVQYFVKSGHVKDVGARDGASPLYKAAQEGYFGRWRGRFNGRNRRDRFKSIQRHGQSFELRDEWLK